METAGNLKHPVWPVHYATIDSSKVNLYYDTIEKVAKLMLDNGTTIPMNANTSVSVTVPKKGRNKITALAVDPVMPCEECDYEFGVQVRLEREQPGVGNDEVVPHYSHPFSKILKLGSASGGNLANADQMTMITEMVYQMSQDTILMQYCEVGTIYKVLAAGNGAVIITDSDGDDQTITGDSPPAMTTAAIAAGLSSRFIGIANSFDYYLLVPYTETLVSVDAVVLGPDPSTQVAPYAFYLESKSQEFEPIIQFKETQYTNISFSYAFIPDFAAALNHRVIINGEYTDVTAIAPEAADTAIDAALTGTNYFMVSDDTTGGITIYSTVGNIDVIPLPDAVDLTPIVAGKKIQWPGLSADDVFREFSQMRHLGEFESLVRTSKPSDVEYVKININHHGHHQASFHGASQSAQAEQRVWIYMPKAQFTTAIFDGQQIPTTAGKIATGTDNSFANLLKGCVNASDTVKAKAEGGWGSFFGDWSDT